MINDTRAHFSYDPDTHTTICVRDGKNCTYKGIARCHPSDWEFENPLLGIHYAYVRSMLKELAANREDIRSQLKGLKHLYNILEQNPRVHYDSIECYTIRRQIKIMERNLADIKFLMNTTKQELRDMIAAEDQFYDKLRKQRSGE